MIVGESKSFYMLKSKRKTYLARYNRLNEYVDVCVISLFIFAFKD